MNIKATAAFIYDIKTNDPFRGYYTEFGAAILVEIDQEVKGS